MAAARYRHFFLWSAHTAEMGDLLMTIGKNVEERMDSEKGPYYYLYLGKQMSESRLAKVTGCPNVEGVAVIPAKELELTRASIEKAKKENDAMVKKGKLIVEILQEDDTPEDILAPAERRAVKAYKKLLDREEERLRQKIANTMTIFAEPQEEKMIE